MLQACAAGTKEQEANNYLEKKVRRESRGDRRERQINSGITSMESLSYRDCEPAVVVVVAVVAVDACDYLHEIRHMLTVEGLRLRERGLVSTVYERYKVGDDPPCLFF